MNKVSLPYLNKALTYVGDEMLGSLLVTSSPVNFTYDWFDQTKYGLSRFSIRMLAGLLPPMHFGPHLCNRIEISRIAGKSAKCRYYMRPTVFLELPEYMAHIEENYKALYARTRCGITSLLNAASYYQTEEWKLKALLRLFLDYVYGSAPSMEEIEIAPERITLKFKTSDVVIYEAGHYDRDFDWTSVEGCR
jgi:hypothetical protein